MVDGEEGELRGVLWKCGDGLCVRFLRGEKKMGGHRIVWG